MKNGRRRMHRKRRLSVGQEGVERDQFHRLGSGITTDPNRDQVTDRTAPSQRGINVAWTLKYAPL
ncbi:SAM-dependent methyltransferase [Bacillus sp. NP157]|nr:SAM-dependent methyltransferase [Bacillus sp. NP157]